MQPQLKSTYCWLSVCFHVEENCGMRKKLKQCLESVHKGRVPLRNFKHDPSEEGRQGDAEEERVVTQPIKLEKAVV
jgi:hypothetical protein